MITTAFSGNDVNENENIKLTHYPSYLIRYYVLQFTYMITVCIYRKDNNKYEEKK